MRFAPRLSVKKGDFVLILSGKDKGRRGKILQVFPKDMKVVVEGINIVKRHTRPTQKVRQGGIIEKPAPLHLSSVMLICPHCQKPTRVRRVEEENRKVRRCRRCGETIDKGK